MWSKGRKTRLLGFESFKAVGWDGFWFGGVRGFADLGFRALL